MAAGVTIRREKLSELRAFLEERLSVAVAAARADAALAIDAALVAGAATPDLIRAVEAAGPFGAGNPEPMFALARLRLLDAIPVGTEHIRLRAASMDGVGIDAIAFRAAGKPLGESLRKARGGLVHLVGSLSLNRWGGRERAELRIVDAAAAIG